jgi:hypothetical protein
MPVTLSKLQSHLCPTQFHIIHRYTDNFFNNPNRYRIMRTWIVARTSYQKAKPFATGSLTMRVSKLRPPPRNFSTRGRGRSQVDLTAAGPGPKPPKTAVGATRKPRPPSRFAGANHPPDYACTGPRRPGNHTPQDPVRMRTEWPGDETSGPASPQRRLFGKRNHSDRPTFSPETENYTKYR